MTAHVDAEGIVAALVLSATKAAVCCNVVKFTMHGISW